MMWGVKNLWQNEEVRVYVHREENLLIDITQISIEDGKWLFAYVP